MGSVPDAALGQRAKSGNSNRGVFPAGHERNVPMGVDMAGIAGPRAGSDFLRPCLPAPWPCRSPPSLSIAFPMLSTRSIRQQQLMLAARYAVSRRPHSDPIARIQKEGLSLFSRFFCPPTLPFPFLLSSGRLLEMTDAFVAASSRCKDKWHPIRFGLTIARGSGGHSYSAVPAPPYRTPASTERGMGRKGLSTGAGR